MRQLRDQNVKQWWKTERSGGRQTWEPLVLSKHSASLHEDGARWPQDSLSQHSLSFFSAKKCSKAFDFSSASTLVTLSAECQWKILILVARTTYHVKYDDLHSTYNSLQLVDKPIYWERSSDSDGFSWHLGSLVLLLQTLEQNRRWKAGICVTDIVCSVLWWHSAANSWCASEFIPDPRWQRKALHILR